jgi:alkanesulfonate monooxygenase SsuD/methylene tetrahydromethanopterin reductase-like flavin-dependent oxidoreductase (luciferase family)
MENSSLYLTGTGAQVRDRLRHWQAQTGLSYISIFDPGEDQVEYLAEEVLAPLRET